MIERPRPPSPFGPRALPPEQERFRDLIDSMSREWVTYALVAANVLVFAVMTASGVSLLGPSPEQALAWGASHGDYTTTGQFWRLFTANYVHFGLMHIGFNMYVLWRAGPMIERVFGHAAYFVGYAFAGFTGSVASVLWNPDVTSAGASGAIFGLFGLLGAFLARRRRAMPRFVLVSLRNNVLMFVVINVAFAYAVPGIDQAAHLGGLAGGFAAGLLLTPALGDDGARRPWALYPIPILAIIAGALAFAAGLFAPA